MKLDFGIHNRINDFKPKSAILNDRV